MAFKYLRTCKACNCDNPSDANKCNHCGHLFSRDTSYHYRVICPDCTRINMASNETCFNCNGSLKNSGCYIATVCYGNYDAPEVKLFRQFRDEKLLTHNFGKQLVKFYYLTSPKLANWLKHQKVINQFVKNYMLNPIYYLLKKSSFFR